MGGGDAATLARTKAAVNASTSGPEWSPNAARAGSNLTTLARDLWDKCATWRDNFCLLSGTLQRCFEFGFGTPILSPQEPAPKLRQDSIPHDAVVDRSAIAHGLVASLHPGHLRRLLHALDLSREAADGSPPWANAELGGGALG